MKKVLIDSSVWIGYFKKANDLVALNELIDKDRICTNKIILAELIPYLEEKKENELIDILQSIEEIPLEIDWEKIIDYQIKNLRNNIRKIGIPDLIILQNVIENDLELFTLDKHFSLMKGVHKFNLFRK